jgi:Flp pilus assembly protein TadD
MLAAALMMSACAQDGDRLPGAELMSSDSQASGQPEQTAAANKTELERATEYWGQAYAKSPRDLNAALSYAKNLKAMGQKSQALAVLQQASLYHASDKKLAAEYGRLALELDQISVARQLLEAADDPANPDWKVISARGTVLAKQGKYKDAIPFYERALALSHDNASVMSNLALAYTMNGEADKAEPLLRRAAQVDGGSRKVRQNLALVLGLQGKYDEAQRIAGRDLPPDSAAANAEYLRQMVRLDAKSETAPAQPAAIAGRAPASPLKPTTVDNTAGPWNAKTQVSAAASGSSR